MTTQAEMPHFEAKEWNASGALYSYGTESLRSQVISVITTDDIRGDVLQHALDRTVERLPFFTQTFVRIRGDYYFADNPLPMTVAESDRLRVLGSIETNYHYADVTYCGRRIDFALAHALTDGYGIMRFVEAVLYHYFCLKDGRSYSSEGIITDETPEDPTEAVDIYAKNSNARLSEFRRLANHGRAFRLPELNKPYNERPRLYDLPIKVAVADLLDWAKTYGATPATALSAIMAHAVAHEHHVRNDNIAIIVPCSLRHFTNAAGTFKNCSFRYLLTATVKEACTMPVGELASKLRGQLRLWQADDHAVFVGAVSKFTHICKRLPFFGLKSRLFALSEVQQEDTFLVDYMGTLRANEYADQISDVLFSITDVCSGALYLIVTETAGVFTINITQPFQSDRYKLAFCRALNELGIPYEELPQRSHLNPRIVFPSEQNRAAKKG